MMYEAKVTVCSENIGNT